MSKITAFTLTVILAVATPTLSPNVGNSAGSVLTVSTATAATATGSGLVARWSLDEGSGSTAADSSGFGNTATVIDAFWTIGKIGGAVLFNGINSFVRVLSIAGWQGDYTVALWVKAGAVGQRQFKSVFSNASFPGIDSFQIDVDGGNPGSYRLFTTTNSYPITPVTTEWQFLAVTLSGTTLQTFNNGVLTNTYTLASGESNFFRDYLLGINRGQDSFFQGTIDEVQVYNRALSASEIQALSGIQSPGSLQFSAATYSVQEDGGNATITVTRTGGSTGAAGVTFATSNGTATAGADYTATTQTVTFADGDTANKAVSIPIVDDTLVEGSETVNLTLSNPTGEAILGSPSTALLTIIDNDALTPPFDFSLSNSGGVSVSAGSSIANTIAASLVSGSSQQISFSIAGSPAGTLASFSAGACNPNCSTILTINTSSSTPEGSFPITVTATGGGVTKTTVFTLGVMLTVATPPAQTSYALSISASSVQAGESVTLTWAAPSGSSARDWVGLYDVGASNANFILNKWTYTYGAPSGVYTVTAPTNPGTYEFRYLLNDGYTDVTRSNAIAVAAASPPMNPVLPSPSCETGVSVAPCKPASQRFLVIAQDGSGQFNNIQAAIDASRPGDTIQVKNGTYNTNLNIPANKSGTQGLPLALVNYPGHAPKVNGNLLIYAEWLLIEGFELTQADNILTMYRGFEQYASSQKASHITIRNNWIHDASYMGVFASSVSDLLFEGNTFERNGLGPKNCVFSGDSGDPTLRYSHCHGIYLGSFSGDPATARVTVRRNKFIFNTGSGFQNRQDAVQSSNYLIENNIFINNQRGMNLSDLKNSVIRNNTFIQFDYPRPNADKGCFYIAHIPNNVIANNACYLAINPAVDTIWPITNFDPADPTAGTKFSHNAFFVWPKTNWIWGNENQRDFLNTYKSVIGDPDGVTRPIAKADGSEAGFMSASDLHLKASSPLIGKGDNAFCAPVDFDGKPRASGLCDIGALSYGP